MTEDSPPCSSEPGRVFRGVDVARLIWSWSLAIALWDAFPVSQGHALIVPRRHAESWLDLTADEKNALTVGADAVRALIDAHHRPDGYNVGFNNGVAAGQTIMHVHLHVIPRYHGDMPDPRGGIRWIFRDKAAYWTPTRLRSSTSCASSSVSLNEGDFAATYKFALLSALADLSLERTAAEDGFACRSSRSSRRSGTQMMRSLKAEFRQCARRRNRRTPAPIKIKPVER
jgi:diadenosine tetraphosphate (Ap4A) HIT family hydrolase